MSDDDRNPVTTPEWEELLADATGIAERYREDGWDAVVLEPSGITPVEDEERFGLDVEVTEDEYDLVARLVERDDVTFGGAEVYYRPSEGDDRRFALAVERDEATETAVFVPLTYTLSESHGVFERALRAADLQIHVRPEAAEQWLVFSHEDPSLFLEESDVREWGDG
ncbi:hypothetical protein CV102_06595 [Natronococcus pandeyae]|uniref:Uncharacterized protein n=1 Tax=Natronococcus pandeyae TaxID=2055836 RepID=A0A8J8Q6E0_9EURY|nr:hypothetical protein [Natronococcus pandeyae]TYL39934.1 hypothetical protein CV102_06595 [Natronococcus pandeyae]